MRILSFQKFMTTNWDHLIDIFVVAKLGLLAKQLSFFCQKISSSLIYCLGERLFQCSGHNMRPISGKASYIKWYVFLFSLKNIPHRDTLSLLTCADSSMDTKADRNVQKGRKKGKICELSGVMYQLSYVGCCLSPVTCHLSSVTCP